MLRFVGLLVPAEVAPALFPGWPRGGAGCHRCAGAAPAASRGTDGQPTHCPVGNSFICKAKVFSRGSVAVSYVFASRCGLRVIRAVVSVLCAEAGRNR